MSDAIQQRDMFDGEARRDFGIDQAIEHAGGKWAVRATTIAVEYARRNRHFTATHVRLHAESIGLEAPPDARAWGSILQQMSRANQIRPIGWERNIESRAHCRPTRVWESLL
jgi:hypothetical protein